VRGPAVLGKFGLCMMIVAVLLGISVPQVQGRDFTVRRKVDGYTLDIAINRNPPILGLNRLRIEVKDPQGKSPAQMPVTVNYYMPPMPGMPPMNYTVNAAPSGAGYNVTMDLIMTGPWNIVIKAAVPGKQLRVTVPIDVR
jgi:hypothetical protein